MNKKYIDRYVYDVTSRLNKNVRDDVSKELTANIYDMLSDNPTKEEVIKVLKELGKPSLIASKYQDKNNYIISPRYYNAYKVSLIYAVTSFVLLSLIVSIVEGLFTSTNPGFVEIIILLFSSITTAIVEDGLIAFAIVTIVFIILERSNINKEESDWSIEDLKEVPKDKSLGINRINLIIGLIFNIIFTSLSIFVVFNHNKYIGWFELNKETNSLEMVAQLFNNNIRYIIIGIVITFTIDLLNNTYLIVKGSKDIVSTILNTIYNTFSVIVLMILLGTKSIINTDFINKVSVVSNTPLDKLMKIIDYNQLAVIVVGVIIIGLILFNGVKKSLEIRKLNK